MSSFLQKIFNDISLMRNESVWMSGVDSASALEDRIELLAEFDETRDFVGAIGENGGAVRMCKKNPKIASALGEKANLLYAQGELDEAMQLYNQALQFCPLEESWTLFGARSAISADREDWKLACRDIDLALDLGDPSPQVLANLLERKCHALVGMARALGAAGSKEAEQLREKAGQTAQAAVEALQTSGAKGNRFKSRVEHLLKLKKAATSASNAENSSKSRQSVFVVPKLPKLASPNPLILNLSDAIKICYEQSRGRFCVAKRKISAGELIAVDVGFTWMLDKSQIKSLCWHCLRPFSAPLPCPGCSGVLFCGKECEEEEPASVVNPPVTGSNPFDEFTPATFGQSAASPLHKYECGITELLFQANIGAWSLALRALAQKPASFYLDRKEAFLRHDEKNGLLTKVKNEDKVYDSSDLSAFHNLVSHDGPAGNKQAPELMMQAMVALFLLRCLQFTGYLPKGSADPECALTEEELFFAKLLNHFMRVAYYNTHESTVLEADGETVTRIGRSTNPSLALFNHSCDPNYRRVSHGRATLGFAVRDIDEGDEILDTYCATFANADGAKRQKDLAKYNFSCRCDPCAGDWPTFSGLNKSMKDNEAAAELKKLESACAKLRGQKDKGDFQKCLDAHLKLVALCRSRLKEPHQLVLRAEDSLYKVILSRHGLRRNHLQED